MRVIETDINDLEEDFSKSKEQLVNDIISFVQPLFSNEYKSKVRELKYIKNSNNIKKVKIKKEKDDLEVLLKKYIKVDKEQQLLSKISKLIQFKLVPDSMKEEMITILKSFNSIPEEKVVSFLNNVMQTISKNFAKS